MTTVSTLLTVIALLILGSRASINFNIAMLVGLIAGTFSSIYIAPTLWLFLEDKYESFRNRRRSTRTKVVKTTGEPEEYVFFGIND
jgi:SecD/SecF fusion protein